MKSRYKNLIYFQNGSIGDFLMTIFLMENIYLSDNNISLNVVVPKGECFLSDMLEKYPYIKLSFANKSSFKGCLGVFKILRFIFSKNLVLTSPTTGNLPLSEKILAKIISLNSDSVMIGFDDRKKINKFFYDKLLKYDTGILYPESIKEMISFINFNLKKEKLDFKYSKDENILNKFNLDKNNYIVFNPVAATKGRSLDIESSKKILQSLENEKVVLIGSSSDREILESINTDNIILIGLDISKLCTLIDNSKLFIGMDTGTSHLASFLGKKSLIIAQNGTPNWLPYYNTNATILYSIENCSHNIYEGQNHLENCQRDVLRRIKYIPIKIVEEYIEKLLKNGYK